MERERAADGGAHAPLRKVPPPTGHAAVQRCTGGESHGNGTETTRPADSDECGRAPRGEKRTSVRELTR